MRSPYEKFLVVLGGRAHNCVMCSFNFPEKVCYQCSHLSEADFQVQKTLAICGGLQILPAGCDQQSPTHTHSSTHTCVLSSRNKKSPVGLTELLSGLGHLSNLGQQNPPMERHQQTRPIG